jgi:hypothetical protein
LVFESQAVMWLEVSADASLGLDVTNFLIIQRSPENNWQYAF